MSRPPASRPGRSPAGPSSPSPTPPTRPGRGPAAARAGPLDPVVTVGFYCAGARRARAGRQREGRRRGRRRPVRLGLGIDRGRRPSARETNGQPPATSPTSASANGSPPGPATRATRSSSSGARSPARPPAAASSSSTSGGPSTRGRWRRRGRLRPPAPRRRRRHDLRAAPRRGRRRQPRCATARGTRSPGTSHLRGPGRAQLVTHRPKARRITDAGPLDPDAFWPFADVIGGSRWPGRRGDRCRHDRHHRIGARPPWAQPLTGIVVISADCHGGASIAGQALPGVEYHDDFDRWAAEFENPYDDTEGPTPTATGARSAGCGRWRPTASSPRSSSPTLSRRSSKASLVEQPPGATDGDLERRWAGLQAHNRWLADFCSQAPGRRAGIAQIMLHDVDASVRADRVGQGQRAHRRRPPARRRRARASRPCTRPTTSPSGTCEDLGLPVTTTAAARCPTWGPTPRPR